MQKQENKQRLSIRYIVERTFGLLKLHRISVGSVQDFVIFLAQFSVIRFVGVCAIGIDFTTGF
jgi:hypothetical protein